MLFELKIIYLLQYNLFLLLFNKYLLYLQNNFKLFKYLWKLKSQPNSY